MTDWLISYGLFALVMSATPGPNNVLVASSGAFFGYRRTLPHMVGICLGFPIMLVACWAGISAVLEVFPHLYTAIQIVGVCYLLYLAWKIATADTSRAGDQSKRKTRPMNLFEGALFQWVNPKAWIIAISALTAFSRQEMGAISQIVWMSAIFMVSCFLCVSLWTLAGAGIGGLIGGERGMKIFNRTMAALLLLSLVVGLWPA